MPRDFDPPAVVRPAEELAALAARINSEHDQAGAAFRASLEHARAAGELLLKAKAGLPHGGWLPWLKQHIRFSERTARNYMRVADRWQELQTKSATVADLTYRAAVEALAEPTETAELTASSAPPVPPPLAYYRESGLLNGDMLGQLLDLADDYGPEVCTDLQFEGTTSPSSIAEAFSLLNEVRPLDQPALWPLLPDKNNPLTDRSRAFLAASQLFFESGRARPGTMPQWEVTAFWWASSVICAADFNPRFAERPASILAHHLDTWRESFRSALAWMDIHDGLRPGAPGTCRLEKENVPLWWGFAADLRHAGVFKAATEMQQPGTHPCLSNSLLEGLLAAKQSQDYPLPSNMQGRLERFFGTEDGQTQTAEGRADAS